MTESPKREWVAGYDAMPARERRGAGPTTGSLVGGRYRLEDVLGHGGLGVVFRARDTFRGSPVAVKLLRGKLTPTGAERLRREAELLATLDHPGIVQVRDSGETPDGPYLVQALVSGAVRLDEALPKLDRARRLAVFRDVVAAVAHAHEKGVVHRDIKAANVLLDREGRVFVIDFGAAWSRDAESLTDTGALVGTPYAMAPEQLAGKNDAIGPHTDVWALGVLLHRCLVDRPPFEAASLVDLGRLVLETRAPRLRSVDPSVPAPLDALAGRCLERDAERRYADARSLLADLDAAIAGRAPAASAARPLAPLLIGLAGALVMGGTTFILGRRSAPHQPARQPVAPATSMTTASGRSPAYQAAESAARNLAAALEVCLPQPDARGETADMPVERCVDRLKGLLAPLDEAEHAAVLEPVVRSLRKIVLERRTARVRDERLDVSIHLARVHLRELLRGLKHASHALRGADLALEPDSCPRSCGAEAHRWVQERLLAAEALEGRDALLALTLLLDGYNHAVLYVSCPYVPVGRAGEMLVQASERLTAVGPEERLWAERSQLDTLVYRSMFARAAGDRAAAHDLGRDAILRGIGRDFVEEAVLGNALLAYAGALIWFKLPVDPEVERVFAERRDETTLMTLHQCSGKVYPLSTLQAALRGLEGKTDGRSRFCRMALDKAIREARR